jgi:hypothetical protein
MYRVKYSTLGKRESRIKHERSFTNRVEAEKFYHERNEWRIQQKPIYGHGGPLYVSLEVRRGDYWENITETIPIAPVNSSVDERERSQPQPTYSGCQQM